MKHKSIFPRIALLLLVGACLSVNMLAGTWAKYAANSKGTARARFAAFDPVWEYRPELSDLPAANLGAGFIIHPGNLTKEYKVVWRLYNEGETTIKGSCFPYINKDLEAAGVHFQNSIGYYRSAMHGSNTRLRIYYEQGTGAIPVPGPNLSPVDWWPLLIMIDSAAEKQVDMGDYVDFTATIKGYDNGGGFSADPTSAAWLAAGNSANLSNWVNSLVNAPGVTGAYYTHTVNVVGVRPDVMLSAGGYGDASVNGGPYHGMPWKTYRVNFDGIVTQVD